MEAARGVLSNLQNSFLMNSPLLTALAPTNTYAALCPRAGTALASTSTRATSAGQVEWLRALSRALPAAFSCRVAVCGFSGGRERLGRVRVVRAHIAARVRHTREAIRSIEMRGTVSPLNSLMFCTCVFAALSLLVRIMSHHSECCMCVTDP